MLRSRSGYTPPDSPDSRAAFTIKDPMILNHMTDFVIKYGSSQTAEWKEKLRVNLPVYHLDIVASAGSKVSPFVITTSQVERVSI